MSAGVKKALLLLFSATALWLTTQAQQQIQSDRKLHVLVLYESLCPDSIRFMEEQLAPSYEMLKDYVNITLIPFGKSRSTNNGAQFHCQHGPAECAGNRQQSCVLQQTDDQTTQVQFAICQMTAPDKLSVKYCAETAGLSAEIDRCVNSDLGTWLQLKAERITHSYAPSFVPTIVYDHVFDQQLQDNSLHDFLGTVCYLLQRRRLTSFHDPVCQ